MADHVILRTLQNRSLWLILSLALLVRVVYLWEFSILPDWAHLTVDNWYHHHWAESIALGNLFGDTTYFRAPGYPWLLGLCYAVFGSSLWVGRLLGLVIGVASVAMTFLLGKKVLGERGGVVASLLHALYPIAIYFESELLLDGLFTLLVQVTIYQLLLWHEQGRAIPALWCGLLLGLAAITRPTILITLPLFLWPLEKRELKQLPIFLAALACVVGIVLVRNLVVAGDPVLVSSQGGINLFIGNNDSADGLSAAMPEPLGHNWQIRQITEIAEAKLGRGLKPGEVSAFWRDEAVAWIGNNPVTFARSFVTKVAYQLSNREIANNRSLGAFFAKTKIMLWNPLCFGLIIPFALLGSIFLWRRRTGARILVLFILFYMVAIALFFFTSRFRLPLLPLYFVLAAGGLLQLIVFFRERSYRLALAILIVGAMGFFSFRPPVEYPGGPAISYLMSGGIFDYAQGEYQKALVEFRKAERQRPGFPEVNLSIGATLLKLGRPDSARVHFEREIRLHPGRFRGYQNLASLELARGDYPSARQWAEQAAVISPWELDVNRVLIRAHARDVEVGDSSLIRVVALCGERTDHDPVVMNDGAAALSERGLRREAGAMLLLGVNSSPPPIETDDGAFRSDFPHQRDRRARTMAESYYQLGYLGGVQGEIPAAIRYSRLAIELDSTLVEAHVNLISAYLVSEDRRLADSVLTVATRRFPTNELVRELIRRQ